MRQLRNAVDFREAAQRRLPRMLFEYIDRGTEDEFALSALRQSLDAIQFMPYVLTGHAVRDISTSVFGQEADMPIVVAPTALAGLVSHNGEIKMARAAAKAGIPVCISTQSITTIEEIRAGAPSAMLWFQLYVWKDRSLTKRLLERVAATGVTTLVVTVDTPVVPNREYNLRNGFSMPMKFTPRTITDVASHPRWLLGVLLRYLMGAGMPVYGHYPEAFRSAITRPSTAEAVKLEDRLNWEDLRQLRKTWKGQLVIKGIFSVGDARKCVEIGADGLVVSSHGGRNIDSAPPTAQILPDIADAVGDQIEVLADSGVRRGSDVLKYLSLGARSVMLGRLPLWGLACGGEEGADALFRVLRNEIDVTLALLGARTANDIQLRLPG
ncbi:alpha-hydroxy acid oxidase [Neorhizobium sp. NCHU2750]|uniref:alpha-hydroxy acid oxidase n=1 Tax=Neorhizobium sp. NCHU2750 TaxID=1825976 RepID=UPI000E707A73|nr:L-lactate dehydrogenase [Neorhizobium sp. NCHU2750]